MIARIWHGVTPRAKAGEYIEYLKRTGVADYRATGGNRGVQILRRMDGERAHFLIVTFWDSLEAVKGFAGEQYDRARYYPEDGDYLLEFEERVLHYDVVFSTSGQ